MRAVGAGLALVIVLATAAVLVVNLSSTSASDEKGHVEIFKAPPIGPNGVIAEPSAATGPNNTPVAAGKLQHDPEEKYSYPDAKLAAKHEVAALPAASSTKHPAAGAMTDAQVSKALRESRRSRLTNSSHVVLLADGTAAAPVDSPAAVQGVVAAGNTIADFPYIWGGGHGSFSDSGYDCSGSVSYALAGGGLLREPLVSGDLAHWGQPGPGKWITIYANAGHVFMYVGGLRFDTSGRDGPLGSRWQNASRSLAGFSVRHPAGL